MEKERRVKLLSIIALVLAISAMTLGFAAFSTTLNISSSATVTPNSSDFQILMVGFENIPKEYENVFAISDVYEFLSQYESLNSTTPLLINGALGESANINSDDLTIDNVNVTFTEPGQKVMYYFVLGNSGMYTAYGDSWAFDFEKKCIPQGDTSENLVNEACSSISSSVMLLPVSEEGTLGIYDIDDTRFSIEPYNIVLGCIILQYSEYYEGVAGKGDAVRADGPFTVELSDVKFNFTTTPPSE